MGQPTKVILGRRNCSHCGRWRPISDFGCLKRTPDGELLWLNSWCRSCDRARRRVGDDPLARIRKAEDARIQRRLAAARQGRTIAAYKVLNPWTGNRVHLAGLELYMRTKGLA